MAHKKDKSVYGYIHWFWEPIPICVGGFPTQYQVILQTPAGCPTIQLISDTIHPDTAPDSTG